ncbi:cardiolipin synthase (CMP-forming), mitochondrial [Malania oleifera]|uniref:cardiolipin synthase (CMP-forming), mitochondrial n=1 Tax=Malania oleifera TaxID=397392 RepID=UPI0025ADD011|nr:cardiolipin synthase (CMP-forming), mitochondrial [Malania oleifera]
MAIFRSLKTLIRKPNRGRPAFLTFSPSATPHPSPSPPLSLSSALLLTYSRSRFLSPLARWMMPFPSPLFLSSPPWKLSQSATPLYVQCDAFLLRNVDKAPSLATFPIRLGLRSSSSSRLLNGIERKFSDGDAGVIGSGFALNFVNLPNLISISRMVSGPLIGWMITNEYYLSAFVGLAISGASDWLDGYMARKMRINSVIGSYLDPLADKVLIGCVALAMVHENLLHPGLVGLFVLRDGILICGALYKRASNLGWLWKSWFDFFNIDETSAQKIEPLFLSKVNTVFQLVLVAAALLQPEFGTPETQSFITYLSWLVASTTVASTAGYGMQHIRKRYVSVTRNR